MLQSCPALCDPKDYSLTGSSIHKILQARILEWVAMPASRGSSWLGIEPGSLLCLLNWKAVSLSLVPPGSPKEAECQRTDAFEVWCWRRLLRVPWTARRSNQSILKEINVYWKDWCWSWSSNTLTTWFEELTHWKSPWCWERLRLRKEGGDRRNCWMASSTPWTWVWANLGR